MMVKDKNKGIIEFKRVICAGFCGKEDGYHDCPCCILRKLDEENFREIKIRNLIRQGEGGYR